MKLAVPFQLQVTTDSSQDTYGALYSPNNSANILKINSHCSFHRYFNNLYKSQKVHRVATCFK